MAHVVFVGKKNEMGMRCLSGKSDTFISQESKSLEYSKDKKKNASSPADGMSYDFPHVISILGL